MKSLIYIEIVKEINFTYQKEFIVQVKQTLPDLEIFDLDNFSDNQLINFGIEIIKRSDCCFIVIKVEEDTSPGKMMPVMEEIIRNKEKCITLIHGSNGYMAKITRQLGRVEWLKDFASLPSIFISFIRTWQ